MSDKEHEAVGVAVRSIFKIGKCLAHTLPKEFVDSNGLKKGDKVIIYYGEFMHTVPLKKKKNQILKKIRRAKELQTDVGE